MRLKKRYILLLVLIIFFSSIAAYFFWGIKAPDAVRPKNISFIIKKGESVSSITRRLADYNLIRSRIVFYLVIKQMGIENSIQAGTYQLSTKMNVYDLAKALTKGTNDVWIRIIEGWRKEEVLAALQKDLQISRSEFMAKAQEGKLFPDTYLVPKNYSTDQVLALLLSNFNKKFQALKNQYPTTGLSDEQILILASLVEKEARTFTNMQKVASILKKRLLNNWKLEVDATVQYAAGFSEKEKTWWRKNITNAELSLNSPYNTRLNSGLPPTPICNPGLNALKAVFTADESIPYWFYLTSKDGSTMHYAVTLEEHNINRAKYLY